MAGNQTTISKTQKEEFSSARISLMEKMNLFSSFETKLTVTDNPLLQNVPQCILAPQAHNKPPSITDKL